MIFLLYFLKVFLYSGILFGYYWLFLRNRRFHHYNRYYLLATLVLSVSLPFIKIPVFNEGAGTLNQAIYQTVSIVSASSDEPLAVAAAPQEPSSFSLSSCSWLLYTLVVLCLLTLFIRSLWYIRKISRQYSFELIKQLKFYQTREPGTPFSFFRSVFWNDQLSFNSPEGQQIFRHELFHVEQKHTVDILLAELITIAGWFNPFFYLIKKELKAIHEFLADQYATSGSDRYAYAELLVNSIMRNKHLPLTHPFFQHHLKRRITMIIQQNTTRYGYWSRLMALPVSLLLFFSMALYAGDKKSTKQASASPEATIMFGTIPYEWQQGSGKIITDTTLPGDQQRVLLELRQQVEQQLVKNLQLAKDNNMPVPDTAIPANEQRVLLNLKLKAEQEAVQTQRILLNLKLVDAEKEELRNKQLALQKVLAEKNVKTDKKVSLALQQELREVLAKQSELEHTQNNIKTLKLQQEKEQLQQNEQLILTLRDDAAKRITDNKQLLQLKKAEDESLEKERELLIIEQKQLELKEDKVTAEQRLKEIQGQRKVLDLVLRESAGLQVDTMEKAVNRYLCRNLRTPELAIASAGQGTVYCSVLIDEDGKFNDFQAYDELPAAAGGHSSEIVVVSYPAKGKEPGSVSEAELRKAYKAEIERAFGKKPGIPTYGKVIPKVYYFRLNFRMEQDK